MSTNVLDLLQGQLSEGMLESLTQQIGAGNKEQTAAAASGVISTLLGGLAKNAQSEDGAASLANALDKDHDGGVLDNLMDLFQGNKPVENERTLNGEGIINHILGNRKGGAVDMISKMSGLDSGKTGSLFTMLAPVVMGALGRQKKQEGLDVGGLMNMLNGVRSTQQQAASNNPALNMVTSFLDSDGDGSIMDDVADIGMKFLGNLFRK
jgi:hypothetical protein